MSSSTAATCCTEVVCPRGWPRRALAPLKRLASSGVPVLLVPGNHERGRIPYPLLAVHEGLHVFDRPRSVVIDAGGVRVEFIGFPYTHDIRRRFPQMLAAASRQNTTADVCVLCLPHCVEGATCSPGNFTFRFGADVIRTADLPRDVAVTLSGHIHRHQVLRPAGRPPVIYAGSVERTSFAEAPETKGFVVMQLTQSGVGPIEFRPLPARPMVSRIGAGRRRGSDGGSHPRGGGHRIDAARRRSALASRGRDAGDADRRCAAGDGGGTHSNARSSQTADELRAVAG